MKSRAVALSAERVLLGVLLGALLWPLVYAVWISFSPGDLLAPPGREWSLRWYSEFWASARWTSGLANSLIVAGWSVAISLFTGACLALALARRRARWGAFAAHIVMLPLFVPPIVLGMALLPFVRQTGLWGSTLSLAFAHSLLSLPVVYLLARNALEAMDPDLLLAARGLGADPRMTLLRVILPAIAPALVIGALSAFVLSLNEFVIALFLATPAIDTLPKVIWPNLRYTLTPLVAAASTITVVITAGAMLAIGVLRMRRGPTASD